MGCRRRVEDVELAEGPRRRPVRHGFLLGLATVAWNVVEGLVAVSAGALSGSIALVGFGVDSSIETSSGAVVAWRFARELRGLPPADVARVERRASRLAGTLLLVLAGYLVVDGGRRLLGFGGRAEGTLVGIVLTAVSLAVMPLLGWAKLRTARALDSGALRADAWQTIACAWLSLTTLTGLLLNTLFGWSWATRWPRWSSCPSLRARASKPAATRPRTDPPGTNAAFCRRERRSGLTARGDPCVAVEGVAVPAVHIGVRWLATATPPRGGGPLSPVASRGAQPPRRQTRRAVRVAPAPSPANPPRRPRSTGVLAGNAAPPNAPPCRPPAPCDTLHLAFAPRRSASAERRQPRGARRAVRPRADRARRWSRGRTRHARAFHSDSRSRELRSATETSQRPRRVALKQVAEASLERRPVREPTP
jgi:hypothetical protein